MKQVTNAVKGTIFFLVEFEGPLEIDGPPEWFTFSGEAEIEYDAERGGEHEDWWIEYIVGSLIDIKVINAEGDELDIPEDGPLLDAVVDVYDQYLLNQIHDTVMEKCKEDANERSVS